jgi:glutaredoxin
MHGERAVDGVPVQAILYGLHHIRVRQLHYSLTLRTGALTIQGAFLTHVIGKMKKAHVLAIVVCLALGAGAGYAYQNLNRPAYPPALIETGDYRDYYREGDQRVIVYTLSTCSLCDRMRTLLDEHAIGYTEREIDSNAAFRTEALALNARSTPLLLIGNHKIEGYDEKRTLAILRQENLLK